MVNKLISNINFTNHVEKLMPLVEKRMSIQADGHHSELQAVLKYLLGSGGKRVRPIISLLVGGMINASTEKGITLAAAVELLHTATLVHDDLIDGALLRRGNATLNAKWSPAATILTGDFIFARAAKLAAETNSVEIMNLFASTLSVIVNGEITQMFTSKGLASRKDYFSRIYAKTASLFELASIAPAYLTDSNNADLEALQKFGYEIGIAFQIVDDILDFTGTSKDVGKPVANDLRQGLITLPALCYIENNPNDPNIESAKTPSGRQNKEALERLINSIRNSGAINSALDEAKKYAYRGIGALSSFNDGPEKESLISIATYIVDRKL
jgi:geranylgeranyl pyrophosphate synthase